MTTTPKDVLVAARKLIEDPAHWTQGSYARDAAGRQVGENSANATCWCAFGALYKVGGVDGDGMNWPATKAIDILANVAWDKHHDGIVGINDKFGHRAVVQLFDDAIALAEGVA